MAYAPVRSPNAELNEGATDGKYKKVVNDRGGFVERGTYAMREELYPLWYGIREAPLKEVPARGARTTPNYVHTMPGSLL